jgi:uncharacterized protein (TIGR02466 family)
MTFLEPQWDSIFSSFIFSFVLPSEIQDQIMSECVSLRQTGLRGVKKSNLGGWQSDFIEDRGPGITYLIDSATAFAREVVTPNRNLESLAYKILSLWVNFNSASDFNEPHTHGDTKITGVYYVRVPQGAGELCLIRPDHNPIFPSEDTTLRLVPQQGRVYLFPGHLIHYVLAGDKSQTEQRVSIAFNMV